MATKKKPAPSSLLDKLRKAFMTRDSEAFEAAANEMTGDEDESGEQHIHIHMPGAAGAEGATVKDGGEGGGGGAGAGGGADPMDKVLGAIAELGEAVKAIGDRVAKLEAGGTATGDADDDEDDDEDGDGTGEGDGAGDGGKGAKPTADSAGLRDEFQDALSRAEILAPGVKLPTYDSKSDRKKTADSICVLRRRALRASLANENADLVQSVTGGADVSKLTCDAAKVVFNAASELVKQRNKIALQSRTGDGHGQQPPEKKDINQIHAEFWKTRK